MNVTTTDAGAVQALFEATLALRQWPPAVYNGPVDAGVRYHLTFDRHGTQTGNPTT